MTHKQHFLLLSLFFIIFTPLFFLSSIQYSSVSAQSAEENIYGWAWGSENGQGIGWISFNSKNCDTDGDGFLDRKCGGDGVKTSGTPYGVKIRNNSQLWGEAWAPNLGYMTSGTGVEGGWITFGPSRDTKTTAPSAPTDPTDPTEKSWAYIQSNQLKGWARACSVFVTGCDGSLKPDSQRGGWDGWIKLSGKASNGSVYGVTRSTSGDTFEYDKYAWGGGDNSNFIGWINFNPQINDGPFCGDAKCDPGETYLTCPSDCKPPVPPGGGGYCGDGICSGGGENCFTCAQDCGSCGGGDGMCPDGKTPIPNPSGVFQGDLVSCPVSVASCLPYQGGVPVTKIDLKNGAVTWRVVPEGATNYVVEWSELSGTIIPGTLKTITKTYSSSSVGSSVGVKVVVKDSTNQNIESDTFICGLAQVVDSTSNIGSLIPSFTPNPLPVKFIGTQTSTTTSGVLKVEQGLSAPAICTGSIRNLRITQITKPNGDIVSNSSLIANQIIMTPLPTDSFSVYSIPITFTLKNRNINWLAGTYAITLEGDLFNGTNCSTSNIKTVVTLSVGAGGGEYIEQ